MNFENYEALTDLEIADRYNKAITRGTEDLAIAASLNKMLLHYYGGVETKNYDLDADDRTA